MQVIEQELKLLLEYPTYEKLLSLSTKPISSLIQTNYYFDTPDLTLEKNGITLRIRNENGRWALHLKAKKKKETNCPFVSSMEIKERVTEDLFEVCKNHPSEILNIIPVDGRNLLLNVLKNSKLQFLGYIKNERSCIKIIDDFSFELDHSEFPGGQVSYELEIEGISSNNDCESIIEHLKKLGCSFQINQKSKYKRFVEALKTVNTK